MSVSPAPSEQRFNTGLALLRMSALGAVVWIHAAISNTARELLPWARFGVPVFIGISVALHLARDTQGRHAVLGYALRRARDAYLLFLSWNAIYLVVRLCLHAAGLGVDRVRTDLATLVLVGLPEHLWFMSFFAIAVVATGAILELRRRVTGTTRFGLQVVTLLAGLVMSVTAPDFHIDLDLHPVRYWLCLAWDASVVLLCFWGLADQIGRSQSDREGMNCSVLLLGAGAALVAASVFLKTFSCLFIVVSAILLVEGAWRLPLWNWAEQPLQRLSRVSLGVYLVHPLFVHGVHVGALRCMHLDSSWQVDVVAFISGIVLSGISVWFGLRNSVLKRLFTFS